ncbi:hypothetical protein EPVG_00055 [Emiliania huxleyi virus 201]|nr:hypothetical protein ELVG_00225 [Emiliania huxleyi virus 203]AET97943.1 hypothetical protein EPVG_00055 [Emiliania huxleyi virus 201]
MSPLSNPKHYSYVDSKYVKHITYDKKLADKYNTKSTSRGIIIGIIISLLILLIILINIPGFTELFAEDKYGPGYRY